MGVSRLTARRSPGGRRSRVVVAALAFAGVSSSFMQTIVLPFQSEWPTLLGASRSDASWIVTTTLLVGAVSTPIAGRLGDMYGKRRIAVALLGLLVLGSAVCALSWSITPMLIGRALQGAAMGVVPLGIAILRDFLPPARLGSAIALISATIGMGAALALPISAFVVANSDWHTLFWAAAALSTAALALVALVVP